MRHKLASVLSYLLARLTNAGARQENAESNIMISFHKIPSGLSFFSPAVLVASFMGSGLIRPASGTWGSLSSVLCAALILPYVPQIWFVGFAAIAYVIGLWASHVWIAQEINQEHADPQAIVIDEVAGQWLAIAFAPSGWLGLVLAFALFRFFDITKVWPASWADKKLHGAQGVMLDDIFAGLWAVICLLVIQYFEIL